jgi:hypothetical protein
LNQLSGRKETNLTPASFKPPMTSFTVLSLIPSFLPSLELRQPVYRKEFLPRLAIAIIKRGAFASFFSTETISTQRLAN